MFRGGRTELIVPKPFRLTRFPFESNGRLVGVGSVRLRTVSVELTLEFDGLVIKHAVAYPGPSEPAFGYSRVRVENVDVWWRQRLVVPGREPVVTTSIRPRRVVVGRIGRALSAVADYA